MTDDEAARRYRPEPDEAAQTRHDREDREADHTPTDLRSRQGSSTPPSTDGAPYQRPPSRGRTAMSPADLPPVMAARRAYDREALAVARELRGMAAEREGPPNTLRMLADRLDGGQSHTLQPTEREAG